MRRNPNRRTGAVEGPEPLAGPLRVDAHRRMAGASRALRNPFFDRRGRRASVRSYRLVAHVTADGVDLLPRLKAGKDSADGIAVFVFDMVNVRR